MKKPVLLYINHNERERLQCNLNLSKHYHIVAFNNIDDAQQAIKNNVYDIDVCVCVINYPIFTHVDFLQKIRAQYDKTQLPVIFIYPREMGEFARLSLASVKSQINDIFIDPISYDLLKLRLDILLKIKQQIPSDAASGKFTRFNTPVNISGYGKRLFDIVASLTALLILLPLFLVVALLIRLESSGGVFYKSKRVGAYYKVFSLLKFRTMQANADQQIKQMEHLNQYQDIDQVNNQAALSNTCAQCVINACACTQQLWKDNGVVVCEKLEHMRVERQKQTAFKKFSQDPRVTPIGRFLRKTSIDELPQLINVLRGDMSLVGNRPLPLYEAEKLTRDHSVQRFNAPAGITGLWQVTKRGKADMSAQERVALDNEYAQKHSFWLDMKIIFQTIPALLQTEKV
ncbi:sugar transferase [uncultured Microscilla sp.]|uniref:sugar transferase n=1 Tax=uncultured Microscilla sp. TaxID=432653 RepID=UPI002612E046|nr:sugar transferase [uncultured Microscilla sp.]